MTTEQPNPPAERLSGLRPTFTLNLKSLKGKNMPKQRFLIETSVESADGSQTWFVDAEDEQLALALYKAGKADIYSSDVEVLQVGKPQIVGTTNIDDKGELANIDSQRDHYADLLRRVSACFTRDDDLPDGLLPEIDAALGVTA